MKHLSLFFLVGLYSVLFTACFFRGVATDAESSESVYLSASKIPQGALAEDEAAVDTPPQNKIVMSNLGAGVQEIELELFQDEGVPLAVYLPANEFKGEITDSEAGKEVHFYYEPNGNRQADVHIYFLFPQGSALLEDVQNLVLAEDSALNRAGLAIVDRTEVVSYPWVKEKFVYQQADPASSPPSRGFAFIGENLSTAEENDFFVVMVHYPEAQSEAIEARTALILDNVEFLDGAF
jgi:hypothetical protein